MSTEALDARGSKKPALGLKNFITLSGIGKGAYGKVLLVRNVQDQKLYAMKILKKEHFETARQQQHVRTERNVLVEMNRSPFLVGFYGSFQNSTKLYFVLEYCPGGELFHRFQYCKRFDEAAARFYAAQILLALDYLHRKNIVYRDLKLENVLVGADGYIKVADFGLSRANMCGDEARSIVGTSEYLAPEVVMKMGYGKAVDWWAFGALIFEMLCGLPPFYSASGDRRALIERIKFVAPRYPGHVSPLAQSLMEGLLRKDPTFRLGAGGADEVKAHLWFREVNFDDVLNKRLLPPFVPRVDQGFGLQNFDREFVDMPIISPEVGERNCRNFEGFTWEDPHAAEGRASPAADAGHGAALPRGNVRSSRMNFDPIAEEDSGRIIED